MQRTPATGHRHGSRGVRMAHWVPSLLTGLALSAAAPGLPSAQAADPPPQAAAHTPPADAAAAGETLPTVEVRSRVDLLGTAATASQGTVTQEEIDLRPAYRVGQVLETVPGLVVTVHSGEGKANQYFIRGFNLDHGTDFATFVDDMPVNEPTHAHGQGYTDIHFLMPELAAGLDYTKGPFYPNIGDFGALGSAHVRLLDEIPTQASVSVGTLGDQRMFMGGTAHFDNGDRLLGALAVGHYNGPWTHPDAYQQLQRHRPLHPRRSEQRLRPHRHGHYRAHRRIRWRLRTPTASRRERPRAQRTSIKPRRVFNHCQQCCRRREQKVITPDPVLAEVIRTAGIPIEQIEFPNAGAIARLGWTSATRPNRPPRRPGSHYMRHFDAEIFSNAPPVSSSCRPFGPHP